jgi:predicted nucleotidyltransferase
MVDDTLAHQPESALPDDVQKALSRLREALQEIYLSRLQGIYLYGSYARGEGDEEASDVDVLVVLRGDVVPGREIGRLNALVSEIALEQDLLISVYPIPEEWFENRQSPFLVNARKEAVAL